MHVEHADQSPRPLQDRVQPTGAVFRGPFADGVPAGALTVELPSLTGFGLVELRRMLVIYGVLSYQVLVGTTSWVLRKRGRTWGSAVSVRVVTAFERLGPTFVKLGQLIASSPGLFPQPLADAALRCLDEVPPFPGRVASEMISADLGGSVEEIFRSFDEVPISAASVGQVHACVLPDGREAVVKVQRPGIRRRMTADLRILYRLARLIERASKTLRRAKPVEMIEDLHATTFQELNPALEADRQDRFRTRLGAFGDNHQVTAPEVYWDYCGPRTICMERLSGTPLDDFDVLAAREIDGELVLRRLVKVWMEAAVVHGEYHGDVHAGNLWLLDDGRLAYLDFGIMGSLTPAWREPLRSVFYSVAIDPDYTRIAQSLRAVGIVGDATGTDAEIGMRLQLVMGPMLQSGLSKISLGELLKSIVSLANQYDATSARELVLIGKQVLYFERYAKALAPEWVLAQDLYLLRNVFPEDVARVAADRGITLPD